MAEFLNAEKFTPDGLITFIKLRVSGREFVEQTFTRGHIHGMSYIRGREGKELFWFELNLTPRGITHHAVKPAPGKYIGEDKMPVEEVVFL